MKISITNTYQYTGMAPGIPQATEKSVKDKKTKKPKTKNFRLQVLIKLNAHLSEPNAPKEPTEPNFRILCMKLKELPEEFGRYSKSLKKSDDVIRIFTKRLAKSRRKQFLRLQCPICFHELSTGSVVSTKCGHVFCRTCLMMALEVKPLCPLCRTMFSDFQDLWYHDLYLADNVYDDSVTDINISP